MSPLSPPLPCLQRSSPSDTANALTQLDATAQRALELITPQLPGVVESSRWSSAAAFLTTIARAQQTLGLPSESPALITDSTGTVVSASWAQGIRTADPGAPSVIAALRIAAHHASRHQLDDLGYTLHLIGSIEQFDAPGAIYNFGPSCVHLITLDGFTSPYEPVAPYFWVEAASKRGIRVQVSIGSGREDQAKLEIGSDGLTQAEIAHTPSSVSPHSSQPACLRELSEAWRNRHLPLNSSPSNGLVADSVEARELMRSLHRAACQNVTEGGGPFAAAIVSPQGKVVSFGVNRVVAEQDAIAHGEVSALREARRILLSDYQSLRHPDAALVGYSVVTSSITCISCAEQLARYGIKRLYYDNTKDDIERNTPFTEGPLRTDFWDRTGITVERIATEDSLRLAPFHQFSQGLAQGSVSSYLKDKAR